MFYVIKENKLNEWANAKNSLDFKDEAKELAGVDAEVFDLGKYQVQNGLLVDITSSEKYKQQELQRAKDAKMSENEEKRNVDFITISLGKLKTQTPLGDLKTALVLYEKIAKAQNGLSEGAVRLYDDEGNVLTSPSMSLEQFESLTLEIAIKYIEIDATSTSYVKAIQSASTIEELNTLDIKYGV